MQGVTAILLSLRKKPVIRYEKMSPMAKKLGLEIQVSTRRHLEQPYNGFLKNYLLFNSIGSNLNQLSSTFD